MKHRGISRDQFPHNIQILFFKRFKCSVPAISLKSVSEIRERGVYAINNDEETTRVMHHAEIETLLTVNHLFEIWKNGYSPTVTNASDCVEIFNAVTNHLQQWVGYLNQGIQVSDAPFEELIDMDKFADVIYSYARFERVKRGINYFADLFKDDSGFNLNPTQQFGQNLSFIPLGQSDGTNMFFNPDNYQKEERESFTSELSRLGGTMSQGVRAMERETIFSHINLDKK